MPITTMRAALHHAACGGALVRERAGPNAVRLVCVRCQQRCTVNADTGNTRYAQPRTAAPRAPEQKPGWVPFTPPPSWVA